MQFGLCLPTFEQVATSEAISRAAQLADEDNWDSIWVTDHVLMASNQPHPYGHIYEALTTLAYAGRIAPRAKLGTSIIVLPQRNPIIVAKEAATLDALSAGRVILGVAAGWNEKEFGFLGADFKRRGRRLEESIAIMRTLWTQPNPSFEGRFYRFNDTLFSPKPAQADGIPVWLGGNSQAAAERAARIADGWHVTGMTPDYVAQMMERIRPLLDDRPFTVSARLEVELSGRLPIEFTGPDGTKRRRLGPSLDAMAREVERYGQAGVEHLVLVFTDDQLDTMVKHIQHVAREVVQQFR